MMIPTDHQLEAQASAHLAKFTVETAFTSGTEGDRLRYAETILEMARSNRALRLCLAQKGVQKRFGKYVPLERVNAIETIDGRRKV